MENDFEREIALFRYSLIAPIVANTFEAASIAQYLKNVASKVHTLPNGKKVKYSSVTIRSWYHKYTKDGIEALCSKKRSDTGYPRKLTESNIGRIHELKEKFPYITGKAVYQKLVEEGYIKAKETSLSTVQRYIRENNLKPKQLTGMQRKSFEMEYANDCWQADTSFGPVIKIDGEKKRTYLIAFIDDASRMLTHTEFYFEDNSINMQCSLKKAVAKYGVPRKLFLDNGKTYNNIQIKYIGASIGSAVIYAKPYSPESKGKIERVFKSIKSGWMNTIDWNEFTSLESLNDSLKEYLEKNYINKIHSSINCTPRERFLKDYDRFKFIEKSELDYHFLHRTECKVNNVAVIKIKKKEYEVPQEYIGRRIKIRYLPTDLEKVYIYSDDNKIIGTAYKVKKVDNSKIKRNAIDFSKMEE